MSQPTATRKLSPAGFRRPSSCARMARSRPISSNPATMHTMEKEWKVIFRAGLLAHPQRPWSTSHTCPHRAAHTRGGRDPQCTVATSFAVRDANILAAKPARRPAIFASRVAKPECRTTILTGRPGRLQFYYFTILEFFCFTSIRFQARVLAARVAKPECRTTIFTGRPDRLLFHYFTILVFYCFISIWFQARVLAARVAKPECRTTIFTGRPDRLLFYYFTILVFYCFISIWFQARVFAARAAKPECRTTIFTGRPDRLLFYYFTILVFYCFISIWFQARVFAARAAKPECRTTIFTGRPDRLLFHYFTILVFYCFISIWFQARVFAAWVAKPECRTTIFTGRPDRLLFFLHLGQPVLHVGSRFCMSAKRIPRQCAGPLNALNDDRAACHCRSPAALARNGREADTRDAHNVRLTNRNMQLLIPVEKAG